MRVVFLFFLFVRWVWVCRARGVGGLVSKAFAHISLTAMTFFADVRQDSSQDETRR